METVSSSIKDKFFRYTNYDIDSYFDRYVFFIENHISYIEGYYAGEVDEKNQTSFDLLEQLKSDSAKIIEMFEFNAPLFTEYDFWILKDQVENIISYTETVDNLPKYYRSVKVGDDYKPASQFKVIRKENQSLEVIQRDIAGSTDWENDWRDLSLRNGLIEEGYVKSGGELLYVEIKGANKFRLSSIVSGVKNINDIHGIDIGKNIRFADSDLITLGNDETLAQTVEILMNKGIDGRELLGDTFASFSYPILLRQVLEIFSTDDSFASIQVKDLRRVDEAVYLDFVIETKAGESVEKSITV